MMIKYRWLATLLIGFLWTLTAALVGNRITYLDSFGTFMTVLFGFGVASILTFMVLSALLEGSTQSDQSRRQKVEKILRVLDDEDLDLLRSRLMVDDHDQPDSDGEYQSLDSLLQQQKQKR